MKRDATDSNSSLVFLLNLFSSLPLSPLQVAFMDVVTTVYPVSETGKQPYLKLTADQFQVFSDDHGRTLWNRLDGSSLTVYNGKTAFKHFFVPFALSKKIQTDTLVVPVPVEIIDGKGEFVRDDVVEVRVILAAKNDQDLGDGSFFLSRDHQCSLGQFATGIKIAEAVRSFFPLLSTFKSSSF